MASISQRASSDRRRSLHLDKVVGSQPELGPAPPDGGFGWVILLGAVFMRITMPSLLASYGVYIMKARESNLPVHGIFQSGQTTWGSVGLWIPVFFSASWSFMDPWSRTLTSIAHVRWITVSGIITVSVGLAITSFGVKFGDPAHFYISCFGSGFLAGVGVSLATTPADHLLTRYFRQYLSIVQNIARIAQAVGYCIMPMSIFLLLMKFGYRGTLLIEASLVLQGIMAGIFFQHPVYTNSPQNGMSYILLEDEDDIGSADKHNHHPHEVAEQEQEPDMQLQSQPQQSTDFSEPKTFYDSMPRPLFSDAEIASSGYNTAFFIEEPTNEDVILYAYGDHLRHGINHSEELKMLRQPLFHAGLLLLCVTRITNITSWLLLPSLVKAQVVDFSMEKVVGFLSAASLVDVCTAVAWHWLAKMSPLVKKRLTSSACFISACSLYALSYSQTLKWLIGASVMLRLGVSIADTISKPMLRESMTSAEFRNAHTLLDILTGLMLLLFTLTIGEDYRFSFWILSFLQVASGVAWGLQPLLAMCCSNWNRNRW